ncbi:MAG: glycoside hydrolase family 5 protein [Candidatus Omnitrophica bacterium]|nr:glycoside hydrolase family 5 protein [Candidatus Omnitrophota bacterium]
MLRVDRMHIVESTKRVTLKGVNLGGWLMPEGYIMHAPNRGYRFFKENFIKSCGPAAFEELQQAFRDNFIREEDFAAIRRMGLNSIRLPFHYGLIEEAPFRYSKKGVGYLDRAIRWAGKNDLRVILDMHAAPGAQNHDWHSDSDGQALFWTKKTFQDRACALWRFLADRYKDEEAVAGYDLLNETVLPDVRPMVRWYQQAINAIREVDRNHIIFAEGNHWAQHIECLQELTDNNLALGIHFYEPPEFTFNFIPGLKYPLGSGKKCWDRTFMRKRLDSYHKIAERLGRPLWCGEFGVNFRFGEAQEDKWLKDVLTHFKALDIHWHYWTWKAMKNCIFPDGVLSYYPNDPWVNRSGPLTGWDTWHLHWKDKKKAMIASWRTAAFSENKNISKVLRCH